MSKIIIIDYGIGNVRSIINAFEKVGAHVKLTSSENEIMSSAGVVLPGVGSFPAGMKRLIEKRLDVIIKEYASQNRPFLGICLGMQLMFSESEEFGHHSGLGIIPGVVKKFDKRADRQQKIPQVGWNSIQPTTTFSDSILHGLEAGEDMYFVHSFYGRPEKSPQILATAKYLELDYCAAVKQGHLYGCQFHPEKSGERGLEIIKNFASLCKNEESK